MAITSSRLVILYEHPEWQKPLFEVLSRRSIPFQPFDLKHAVFDDRQEPAGELYFNQASPSAYLRNNERAVPFVLAYIEDLEARGVRVLNGSQAFRLELSKSSQISLLRSLGVPYPRTWVFNSLDALHARRNELSFPLLLKPNQGGSGARMYRLESFSDLERRIQTDPNIWFPDQLLLLQEYLPHDMQERGIVRMEFLGGELLYAMRVVSGGAFNLCPSEVCHPTDGQEGQCVVEDDSFPVPQFFPFPEVPPDCVEMGRQICRKGNLDVAGIEYLETEDNRVVFYDINANSNLRRPIGEFFGFDPFERVADFLEQQFSRISSAAV